MIVAGNEDRGRVPRTEPRPPTPSGPVPRTLPPVTGGARQPEPSMTSPDLSPITVSVLVNAPLARAWAVFTDPQHIVAWNFASDDWCCPRSENDLRVGGRFSSRMEAKDGSAGFDMAGTYDIIEPGKAIGFTFGDRRADVAFVAEGAQTRVSETFIPEGTFPREMQQGGWQAILDNFKRRAESGLG